MRFVAEAVKTEQRLALRGRPPGSPLMHQTWEKLLFLHWSFPASVISGLIPKELQLDTFENEAWVGLAPFSVSKVHPISLPPIPGASSFHELSLRTYVHHEGIPGVWFFTLEASKLLPVMAARFCFSLPYRKASIQFRRDDEWLHFKSRRRDKLEARFEIKWSPGKRLPSPSLSSLEFFIIERYAHFAQSKAAIVCSRIYHAPWAMRTADITAFDTTLFNWLGLPEPSIPPLVHYAEKQEVDVWAPFEVCRLKNVSAPPRPLWRSNPGTAAQP